MSFDVGIVIQIVVATAASMLVGFAWYSEWIFGRIWWYHTFPGIVFGNCEAVKSRTTALTLSPFPFTLMSTICQNAILAYTINAIFPMVAAHSPSCATGLNFPLTFSAIVAMVCACISFPHYVYPRKPLVLYLIGTGHNTLQIFLAVFFIYFLCK